VTAMTGWRASLSLAATPLTSGSAQVRTRLEDTRARHVCNPTVAALPTPGLPPGPHQRLLCALLPALVPSLQCVSSRVLGSLSWSRAGAVNVAVEALRISMRC
jgi:hypothetical protein